MPSLRTEPDLRNQILKLVQEYFEENKTPKPFIPGDYIPAATKSFEASDLTQLVDASLDLWITAGTNAREFERKLGVVFNNAHPAVLVNSGSSANLLAAAAFGSPSLEDRKPIGRGDEVITVAASFPTTVNPIVQNGWVPVFVDIEKETLNASLEKIQAAFTKKTRAVFLAHPLGNPARVDLISEWCEKENLFLLEDCCDALGATIGEDNRPVGSFGHFATASFYPSHHITTGEGGALVARTPKLRKLAESLRDWGRDCWCEPGIDNTCGKRFDWKLGTLPVGYDHKYTYSNIGYNLKMTDLQAALGVSQLNRLPSFIEKRRKNWAFLNSEIKNDPLLKEHFTPVRPTQNTNPSWFGFPLHCHPGVSRLSIIQFLEKNGVGTRLVFAGNITRQPAYKNVEYRVSENLVETDKVMNDTFWISCSPTLTQEQLVFMLEKLKGSLLPR